MGVAAAAILLGTAACSSSQQPEPTLPEKNRSEWVMPLDDYIVENYQLVTYAEDLAAAPCMQKAGKPYNVPWHDPNSGNGPSMNAAERKLFNVPLAAEWGYHQGPKDDRGFAAHLAWGHEIDAWDDATSDIFRGCREQVAKHEVPTLPLETQLPASLEQAAFDAALEDPKVRKAAKAWRTCMIPQGISDLPDSPDDMPSDSIVKKFGLHEIVTDDAIFVNGPKVAAEEITLATADANCRESSQWAALLYEAEWQGHITAIKDNTDALNDIKRQITAHRKKVLDVIASHAPSAP